MFVFLGLEAKGEREHASKYLGNFSFFGNMLFHYNKFCFNLCLESCLTKRLLYLEMFETLGLLWFVLGDWSMNESERERHSITKEKNLENFETFCLFWVIGQ
jgi:hypothetical protein